MPIGQVTNYEIYEGVMADSVFNFEIMNFDCKDSSKISNTISIQKLEKDSFVINMEYSADKGINWIPQIRFTYVRIMNKN